MSRYSIVLVREQRLFLGTLEADYIAKGIELVRSQSK